MKATHRKNIVEAILIPFDCLIEFDGQSYRMKQGDVIIENEFGERYPLSQEKFTSHYNVKED